MYSTCLFCSGSLGTNEAIEHFPVGRRLAFDVAKGRLWVVCRTCERWNLTPLEERWEAVEECERAFDATPLRMSTDQIGLARLSEGLELVRIGAPLRPEMAAWRYGDQFGRRMRRHVAWGAAGVAGIAAVVWGGPALGLWASAAVPLSALAGQAGIQLNRRRRTVLRVRVGEGDHARELKLADLHIRRARLVPTGEGWQLDLPYLSSEERLVLSARGLRHLTTSVRLENEEAHRAVARVLPYLNRTAGRDRTVRDAVHVLEVEGSVERCFIRAAGLTPAPRWLENPSRMPPGSIAALPAALRLALEMAAHEDSERRALEGELSVLEHAWREAENIANIADNLLLPASVHDFMTKHRPQ